MAYRGPKTGLGGGVSQEKLASEAYRAIGGYHMKWYRQSRYSGTLPQGPCHTKNAMVI